MFVNLSIHYPKAQHRRDLIDSMHRFGAAAAGAPGRGAYLCPSQQCFDAAAARRAASRAFRRPVMLDDEARHAFMAACQSREAVR